MSSDAAPIFLPTSVGVFMMSRMAKAHEGRKIAIFSGPPGIGKTAAIDAFVAENQGEVVRIELQKAKATPRLVIQGVIAALRRLNGRYHMSGFYKDNSDVFNQMRREFDLWQQFRGRHERLTLIFDEAQRLKQNALEELRSIYDNRAGGELPFQLGMIFVGNNTFSMRPDDTDESAMSSAFFSRTYYRKEFGAACVTREDAQLLIGARGVTDPAAVAAILTYFLSCPPAFRQLRELDNLLSHLADEADGEPATLATVRSVLQPA